LSVSRVIGKHSETQPAKMKSGLSLASTPYSARGRTLRLVKRWSMRVTIAPSWFVRIEVTGLG